MIKFITLILTSLFISQFTMANEVVAPSKFKPISDINFDHLKKQPQLTWGKNAFSQNPGFVALRGDEIASPSKYSLAAIIYDKEDPIAIVNGLTVGVQDDIDGMTVEEIGPNYVVINNGDSRFELTLSVPKEPYRKAEIRALDGEDDEETEP